MRFMRLLLLGSLVLVHGATSGAQAPRTTSSAQTPRETKYRTLEDRLVVRRYASLDEWRTRATWLREHVLASAGLLPMPERTPLNAVVFGERAHDGYTVSKAYFESFPGFLVTGNLYKPIGKGPFPAIVSPHGHWYYGRFENSDLASVPGRAINLARQGFVVFTYDMIGYNDSRRHPHNANHTYSEDDFGGPRESLWGLSLAGMQLLNAIRSVDFLQSLPEVARDRIGATGASGGGTQTFLVAAVDDRVGVAAPVNMISLIMQGGCLCENMPGLRFDTNNVELAALIAPRPLLMISATGDWTRETMESEYPEMRRFYALFGKEEAVHAVRFTAEHNYNKDSREAMYAWMARWLKGAPADAKVAEQPFRPDPLPELMVFANRPLPETAVTTAVFTENWIAAAKRQLPASQAASRSALLHTLNYERQLPAAAPGRKKESTKPTALVASADSSLGQAAAKAGFAVRPIAFTPFDAAAAAKISQFEGYNRTAASQRVADIVAAVTAEPNAVLIADGDAALAGLLAAAVVPIRQAILDVDGFDNSSDAAFLQHLYIPGLRRAGDFRTAATLARGEVVVHNAGTRFRVEGLTAQPAKLTAAQVARLLKK